MRYTVLKLLFLSGFMMTSVESLQAQDRLRDRSVGNASGASERSGLRGFSSRKEVAASRAEARCRQLNTRLTKLSARREAVLESNSWDEFQLAQISENFGEAETTLNHMIERCEAEENQGEIAVRTKRPALREK